MNDFFRWFATAVGGWSCAAPRDGTGVLQQNRKHDSHLRFRPGSRLRESRAGWKLSLAVLLAAGCVPVASAQTWGTPHLIPATQQFAMAYDSVHGQTVLFGGFNDDPVTVTNTTWVSDGTRWTELFPKNSPPARYGHAMAYDAARGQVVLFGGNDLNRSLNDTWTWDGADWTRQDPQLNPLARSGHAMAYDAARGVTVLFGGPGATDTWTWDGSNWNRMSPQTSPPARNTPSMAFDAARGQVVMFGGDWSSVRPGGKASPASLADTWIWDGANWSRKFPATSPSGRTASAMTYDSVNRQTVLFGGYDAVTGNSNAETWAWDGTDWTAKSPAATPSARARHSMAYDSARAQTVLFGGALFSDTWAWDGSNWTLESPATSPPPRSGHGMAYDGARQQVVVFGGGPNGLFEPIAGLAYSDTWVWDGSNWTRKLPMSSPSARSCVAMAYDDARQQVVLFGGRDVSSNVLSDTWAWDGANWTRLASSGPPARGCHAMAYDSVHQQVVLFGGEDANGNEFPDTWAWNGSAWTQEFPRTSPMARSRHAMSYDSVQQRVLLFGGNAAGAPVLDDTWAWDGANWNLLLPNGANPEARAENAMAFDSAHRYTVMLGGTNYTGLSEPDAITSTLNGTTWRSSAFRPAGNFAGLAFDALHGKTVLFGGTQAGSNITAVFPANTIGASGGTPQSATPGEPFTAPLQVTVTDLLGHPVVSDTVTFSVDSSFASLSSTTAPTDANGQARITATAAGTGGSYHVTAVAADGGSATFALTNTGTSIQAAGGIEPRLGTAASIAVTGGNAQSAAINAPFGSPLTVVVRDSGGNVLSGISVTFASPASGAGASFSPAASVPTNAQGIASVSAAANATLGAYTVTATTPGVSTPATFFLTNIPTSAYTLAAQALVEPAATGADSILIQANGTPGPWTAASTVNWLHLQPGSTSGSGSGAVGFTFDPNPGAVRSGTITFYPGGLTLTVTQAGSAYLPANLIGLTSAGVVSGVATDAAGKVYYSATSGVQQFNPVTKEILTILYFLGRTSGVAVDGAGNVYGSDLDDNIVAKWTASTLRFGPLISSGLNAPGGLSVDAAGNLYIVDMGSSSIKMWNAATQQVTTLVSGLSSPYPSKPALDSLGNIYFADSSRGLIQEWVATTEQVVTLVSGLDQPSALAVDSGGNLYIATNGAVSKWSPFTQQLTSFSTGFGSPIDLAVDTLGSVYIADYTNFAIAEAPRAYVAPPSLWEQASAGADSLLPVLPSTILFGTPQSDQTWLTVTGTANGVIGFSFATNGAGAARIGHITVLGASVTVVQLGAGDTAASVAAVGGNGQTANTGTAFATPLTALVTDSASRPMPGISVTFAGPVSGAGVTFSPSATAVTDNQGLAMVTATANATAGGPYTVTPNVAGVSSSATFTLTNTAAASYAVGTTSLLEPGAAGLDSVLIQVTGSPAAWTAGSNASWLHLSNGSTSGTATASVVFNFDANTGATRTGTLTLNPGSFTVTVTQAGASYLPGGLITLDGSQTGASSIAVDSAGNLYLIAVDGSSGIALLKWTAVNRQYTALATELGSTGGVALDPSGNVYYSDPLANAVYQWNSTTQQSTTLISSGLNAPKALAVDAAGDVYIADSGGIEMWTAATQQLRTLTGLTGAGIAVDSSGNVYLADFGGNAIRQWNSSSQQLVNIVSSGLGNPTGVAVDAAGNLYIADSGNNSIKLWSAATEQVTTLAYQQSGNYPGIAVDGADNVFVAGSLGIQELVHGFIGPANITEPFNAGSDSLLAAVPSNAPLNGPSSDQTWLTVTGVTSGVVGFNFTANNAPTARVAHIAAMGATVTVTQGGNTASPGSIATTGGSGQSASAGTAFPAPLTAVVEDGNGNPLSGVSVTFAGPAGGGPGATFSPSATVSTNNQGIATVTAAANATVGGPYSVTATVAGVSTPAAFALTNFGAPASIVALTGSGQTALLGTVFPVPLSALVKDSGGNPLSGITVTFTAPASGAGAALSATSAVTNASGIASVTATGNGTAGAYNVTAGVNGTLLTVAFALANSTANACFINSDNVVTVADVQVVVNQALGVAQALNDLNLDGVVNVVDIQIEINAALNLGCAAK